MRINRAIQKSENIRSATNRIKEILNTKYTMANLKKKTTIN